MRCAGDAIVDCPVKDFRGAGVMIAGKSASGEVDSPRAHVAHTWRPCGPFGGGP